MIPRPPLMLPPQKLEMDYQQQLQTSEEHNTKLKREVEAGIPLKWLDDVKCSLDVYFRTHKPDWELLAG